MKKKYGITPVGVFLGWILVVTVASFIVLKGISYFAKRIHKNPRPVNKMESSTQVEPPKN
ncbi:MAG: hypothetical protein V4507_00615 [Verrucomicrobiota bacterium]